jgi:hypothetical protein
MSFEMDERNAQAEGDVSSKPRLATDKLQPTAEEGWWNRRLRTPLGRALSKLNGK